MWGRLKRIMRDMVTYGLLNDEKLNLLYMDYKLSKFKKNEYLNYAKIQKNRKFKDSHLGERCFVLGNGPSLEELEFDMLKNEYVFTVNRISGMTGYEKLNTNFHFLMDYAIFGIRENVKLDTNMYVKEILEVGNKKSNEIFLPIAAREFVKKHKLEKYCNINYFYCDGSFVGGYQRCDLTKQVPNFTTVVQYAIFTAIYMGFKEIYLLGCDGTLFKSVLATAEGKLNNPTHAFDKPEDILRQEKSFMQVLENMKLDALFYDQYKVFNGYRRLGAYCNRKDITLINLTTNSLIDTIPKKKMKEIL